VQFTNADTAPPKARRRRHLPHTAISADSSTTLRDRRADSMSRNAAAVARRLSTFRA
jgi:hypothetical protein